MTGFESKREAVADKLQEPVAWLWKDMRGQDIVSLFEPRLDSTPLYTVLPKRTEPAQEPVAFNEFLESEDFYNLMQTYRHFKTDAAKPFETVKDALRAAYNIGEKP